MSETLAGLWERTKAEVEQAFRPLLWADDEIRQAQRRHPEAADLLYHAMPLLRSPLELPDVEFVFRGHAAELLERVAAGEDTRPGTWAEVALACSRASLAAPLNEVGTGLYMKAWALAFPGHPVYDGQEDHTQWYAGRYGVAEMERATRRRMAQPKRRLPEDLECDGEHGPCRFAPVAREAV